MKNYKVRRYFVTYQDFNVEAENEHNAMVQSLKCYPDGDILAENCEENISPEIIDIN